MKYPILLSILILLSCQTETTTKITDNEPLQWLTLKAKNNANGKHIVLISGDEEYRSEEALPQLAKILSTHHGFDCTVLFAQDPDSLGVINPNYSFNIPGMEHLEQADLAILFTRFRALPNEQMQHFENYLLNGKPLITIRTATHAFNFKDTTHAFKHYGWNYKGDKTDWHLGFGKKILGETWYTHHGRHKHQSTRGIIAEESKNHPILNGIPDGSIWGPTDVYGIRMPMDGDAQPIILGQTIDRTGEFDESDILYGMRESDTEIATVTQQGKNAEPYNPNEPMPPIVWTKSYQLEQGKKGQSLTSTIGASTDMLDEEVRRLFVNGVYYLLDLDIPSKATVDIVGTYEPSAFAFHSDEYWEEKGLRIHSLKD